MIVTRADIAARLIKRAKKSYLSPFTVHNAPDGDMLVLYDEATALHETVELLGAKFMRALECPERIEVLTRALRNDGSHVIRTLDSAKSVMGPDGSLLGGSTLSKVLFETHDAGYLGHLRTIHKEWVADGIIEEHESVLAECFHVAGLSRPNTFPPPPKSASARPGYYAIDMSTGVCKDTWAAACASANLALEAARLVAVPESPEGSPLLDVLALCRPPGHHCTTKLAGGYCYINNAVVAVHSIRHHASTVTPGEGAAPSIAILDLDFHHGNGTQSYFYDDPSVLYVSIHGENEYPYYTGFEDEVGEGAGKGYNLNLPLAVKSPVAEYLSKLEVAIQAMQRFQPEYLIVSLGFDTFHLDPLGSFDVRTDDYEVIASRVREADGLQEVRSVILLEGGYVLEDLGGNMLRFLKGWGSGKYRNAVDGDGF